MWEQFQRLSGSLSGKQKLSIVLAALAVSGGMFLILHQHQERDFQPLYTGLSPEDANQVVNKLKEANVDFRLGENGASVLVRSGRLAETRLLVAGSGLPKTGRMGFEIFDKTNFGITDFSEHINHQRALEGELERSVVSLSEVEQARIHISFPRDSVFSEQRRPAKASVLVKLKRDAILSQKNVVAIEYLVANAVEGLTPDNVNVVDMQGNLLKKISASAEDLANDSNIDYRQKVEKDLLAKIQATLDPVLGPDHFRAGVSAEVDFSKGEQSEEAFDPNRSVMLSQQRTEEITTPHAAAGVPGTASNLPRPTSRPGSSGSSQTKRTENVSYQSSRTVKKTTLPQGSLRRVSVSAVIDQAVHWDGAGPKAKRTIDPPSAETLKKVRELVAGAIGFDEDRGDQIVIETLPFERTLQMPPPPDPSAKPAVPPAAPPPQLPFGIERFLAEKGIKVSPMVILAVGGAVLLVVFGGGLFLILRKGKKVRSAVEGHHALPGPAQSGHAAVAGADHQTSGDTGAAADDERQMLTQARREQSEQELLSSIGMPEAATKKSQVLIKHISEQTKRDPLGAAQLIRSWITEKER